MKNYSIDRFFRAFSDKNRLRILNLLSVGELCVCDIMRVLKMSQPKVSRHLAYLRNAGLVKGRKEGLWVHYSLVAPQGRLLERLLSCLSLCSEEFPTLENDLSVLKEKHAKVDCPK